MGNPQLQMFATLPLFDDATRRQRRAVTCLGTVIDVEPGTVLCREATAGDQLFVVVAGTVALSNNGVVHAVVHAGDWWADGEPLLPHVGVITATARTRVRVLVYERREAMALLKSCPPIALRLSCTGTDTAAWAGQLAAPPVGSGADIAPRPHGEAAGDGLERPACTGSGSRASRTSSGRR